MSAVVPMLGVGIVDAPLTAVVDELADVALHGGRARVLFVNAHCFNVAGRDAAYRAGLAQAEYVLPDGSGVMLGSRLLGTPVRNNLNGTDLVPRLLDALAERGLSVYLLGGRHGVAGAVAARLAQLLPGLPVVGYHHGYLGPSEEEAVLEEIAALRPDVLLVAMGVPKQELWLDAHWDALPVRLGVGVGALFDFMAGRFPRAPRWMRWAGIEWLYRMLNEPGRLWKRYMIGNPRFLTSVVLSAWASRTGTISQAGRSVLEPARPVAHSLEGGRPLGSHADGG